MCIGVEFVFSELDNYRALSNSGHFSYNIYLTIPFFIFCPIYPYFGVFVLFSGRVIILYPPVLPFDFFKFHF